MNKVVKLEMSPISSPLKIDPLKVKALSCPALFVTWFSLQYELWVPFQCHSELQ